MSNWRRLGDGNIVRDAGEPSFDGREWGRVPRRRRRRGHLRLDPLQELTEESFESLNAVLKSGDGGPHLGNLGQGAEGGGVQV